MERLDIIVFGATGYTGSFLVRELATTFKNEKISWGIAGRSGKRLNDLLKSVSMEENSNNLKFKNKRLSFLTNSLTNIKVLKLLLLMWKILNQLR
jgi:short subunit dehydrogenase-like uncharacterized protein